MVVNDVDDEEPLMKKRKQKEKPKINEEEEEVRIQSIGIVRNERNFWPANSFVFCGAGARSCLRAK